MKQIPLIIIFASLIVFGFIHHIEGLECFVCIDVLPNNTDCTDKNNINTVDCGEDKSCYYVNFILVEGNVTFRTCDIKDNIEQVVKYYPFLNKIDYIGWECDTDRCNEGSYPIPHYLTFITTLLILVRYLLQEK